MNVCLYVLYRIVNYAFDHVMIFRKVVVHESKKVPELVQPIFDRWHHCHSNVNCEINVWDKLDHIFLHPAHIEFKLNYNYP